MIILPESKRLLELAHALRDADRMGAESDAPEGSRYIQMSDTLAKEIEQELILTADSMIKLGKSFVSLEEPRAK